MHEPTNANKRIAYNTVLLYVRMLFQVLISLYTSRIVLQTLGVVDFGINNVVGGIITFLNFLTISLAGASSRYITYSLGKGNIKELKKVFNNIVLIHIFFAFIVLVLGETIGLWFVKTQLNIPETRENAAMWVYQFSILTSMGSLISAPYNAAIIAHEKMSAFAYLTLGDSILKLIAVYFLIHTPYDKLIFYAAYILCIQIFDFFLYIFYCKRNFEESNHLKYKEIDKTLFKEIFSFAGWTMNGNLAVFGCTQGLNILLNIFFNPIVNAARGIAVQVQTIVNTFNNNFLMAINPQLTKSYASKNYERVHALVIASSKFSIYLMLLICIPLALEIDIVLKWWLGEYPDYTSTFLRLVLCISLLSCLSNPILTSVHATGRIKKFQIIEGSTLLMVVPVSYLYLKFLERSPESVFIIHIIIEIITQIIRLKLVLPMIRMSMKTYIRQVIFKVVPTFILSIIPPTLIFLATQQNIYTFLLICVCSPICLAISIYLFGLSHAEKNIVISKANKLISSIKL